MPIFPRIHVALRPALLAAALLSLAARLPAQHVGVAPAHDTPLIPLTTQWPSRTAIAVVAPDQANPMTVEATSDGWVIVTPLAAGREDRDALPATRFHVAPNEIEVWMAAARSFTTPTADTTNNFASVALPLLGRGRVHLGPQARRWRGNLAMDLATCEGNSVGLQLSASDLDRFAGVLERAMNAARHVAVRPSLPTLARPYYATEVDCGARPVEGRVAPSFPASIPQAKRRYTEVGVRFIVDTAGFLEPGSLVTLPGAPAAFVKEAKAVVRGWRYRPAEFAGLPVRQIVTTVVAFDPADVATRSDPDRILSARRVAPGDPFRFVPVHPPVYVLREGGWVHVAMGHWRPNGVFNGFQEWLSPDSVDAWVARASQLLSADSAQPKYPRSTFEKGKGPGYPLDRGQMPYGPQASGNWLTVQYRSGWSSDTQRIRLIVSLSGCGAGSLLPTTELDRRLLDRLTTAARAARGDRSAGPALDRTLRRGDVACPAYLPPTSSGRPGLPGLWRYPRAPYPAALSRRNVRAEVLTSFEVDTLGTPIAETLVAAPGSDPRAVAALRQTIDHVRFNPAARAGSKVRTRVIRTWLFEPPPACASDDDGIDCARVYGPDP